MKVAILANCEDSFVLPMAQGLQRMFEEIGVEATIRYDGYEMLASWNLSGRSVAAQARLMRRRLSVTARIRSLRQYDVIVIVATLPGCFMRDFQVERIRNLVPHRPIVNYSVLYLPTRPWWSRALKQGDPRLGIREGGHYGMERYDWYLCGSVVGTEPLPRGCQPFSLIGLNLEDGTLFPDKQGEFVALIDFERPQHMRERAIQIQALEETSTPYIVLNGHYPRSEINEIYRKCSAYFLATPESFGRPICEVQACGAYVFTPHHSWCPSHYIKESLFEPGPGALSANFVIYDDDKDRLVEEINRVKSSYDPMAVLETFNRSHPQLLHGDCAELAKFADLIRTGKVTSNSHTSYGL
jgi:hypothetical protein